MKFSLCMIVKNESAILRDCLDSLKDIMDEIIAGRMTFQKAFMSGDMKMKGDFKVLRTLDLLFVFKNS